MHAGSVYVYRAFLLFLTVQKDFHSRLAIPFRFRINQRQLRWWEYAIFDEFKTKRDHFDDPGFVVETDFAGSVNERTFYFSWKHVSVRVRAPDRRTNRFRSSRPAVSDINERIHKWAILCFSFFILSFPFNFRIDYLTWRRLRKLFP